MSIKVLVILFILKLYAQNNTFKTQHFTPQVHNLIAPLEDLISFFSVTLVSIFMMASRPQVITYYSFFKSGGDLKCRFC